MQTVLVIGGFNKKGYQEMGKKLGEFKILFHDGIIKRQSISVFENLVKKADCVVLLQAACSHKIMWEVKKLSKQYSVPISYPRSRGITSAIQSAMRMLNKEEIFLYIK